MDTITSFPATDPATLGYNRQTSKPKVRLNKQAITKCPNILTDE